MPENYEIIVQKYGGSSVADPQKIINVAHVIKERLIHSQRLCVVVSAMGDTTNKLIEMAHHIHSDPPKRELDMLLSCGERSSMALLAMALHKLGVKAISLTGSQSGIITNECHHGADILAIRPHRVFEAFKHNDVIIIAGFQGMSQQGEITTLKRGGSDTTAIAMTAALKASACEIYSDVKGIMEMDPRIAPHAKHLAHISHEEASSLSLYGAKVLAHDAAKLAQELGVQVLVAQSGDKNTGTSIKEITLTHKPKLRAITHMRGIIKLELSRAEIKDFNAEYFLCGAWHHDRIRAYASNDIAQELLSTLHIEGGLALITVHLGHQRILASTLAHIFELFEKYAVNALDIISGFEQIFIIIPDEMLNNTLCIFQELLEHRA
jgi:aspartate kinase